MIEITPYTKSLHPEWTEQYMNDNFARKKISVSGWLLYDYMHKGESFDTNPTTKKLDRYTVWEIHPIIDLKLVSTP